MKRRVVITGIGMVTPLGCGVDEVLARLGRGESAAGPPMSFDPSPFSCRVCAEIADFDPSPFVPEAKVLRMMNRDAQLAAAAARLAVTDAKLKIGRDYLPHEVGLYGATGLAGIALGEVARLVRASAGDDGSLDLHRFGEVALKQVRPVLSFKILANMAICFVSIFEGIRGPNSVYNPWEGQGAQALAAAANSITRGDCRAALVVGADVKIHELGFIALHQAGALKSWRECGAGRIPGEGAGALLLEEESAARARSARVYARLGEWRFASIDDELDRAEAYERVLSGLVKTPAAIVRAEDSDPVSCAAEASALETRSLHSERMVRPKRQMGDLFAAAGLIQVGIGARLALQAAPGARVLVNCFGFGSEQAAFVLEGP